MFDPFTIGLIITAIAGAAVVYVAYLAVKAVRDYIRERRTRHSATSKAIIMKERLQSGNYSVATGFLRENTKIVDVKQWEAESLDAELLKFPDGQPVIVS